MIKLNQLHYTKCPTCGSGLREQTQRGQHSNGQYFEKQVFECWAVVQWVPNFNCEQWDKLCPDHPNEAKKAAAQLAFVTSVMNKARAVCPKGHPEIWDTFVDVMHQQYRYNWVAAQKAENPGAIVQ